VQEKFETLGIPMKDAEQLFRLMDPSGLGEIKLTEFLASCMQLVSKTTAHSFSQQPLDSGDFNNVVERFPVYL
ncbi:hypothetical protein Pmar_PMAR022259, partial [Perkinsus marinus ATCC 50983]